MENLFSSQVLVPQPNINLSLKYLLLNTEFLNTSIVTGFAIYAATPGLVNVTVNKKVLSKYKNSIHYTNLNYS